MMPIVAMTAVSASSSGTPAATSAPNAISRMIRVTGREVMSALPKSSWTTLLICCWVLASPNSPRVKPGCACCDVGDGLNGRLDAVHDVGCHCRRSGSAAAPSARRRDLVRVRGGQRALEVLGVGERRELALHVDRHGAEAGSAAVDPAALDQHHLLGVLRSGIGDRLIRTSGLADAGLGVLQRLGPGRAADHEGNDDEREPPPDGGLAVLCAPDTSAGRDSARTARRVLVRGTRRHADLHVVDGQSRPYPFEPVIHIEPVSNVRMYVIAYATRWRAQRRPRTNRRPRRSPRTGPSARGSRACARRWISRSAIWPSAAASARRCSPRSSGATPARRWRSPQKIAAGLDLTLSQLLRLDEDRHVVVVRPCGEADPQAARPQGRGADAAPAGPARGRLGAHAGAGRGHRRSRRPARARARQPRDRGRARGHRSSSSSMGSATSCRRATASPSTPTCRTISRTMPRRKPG